MHNRNVYLLLFLTIHIMRSFLDFESGDDSNIFRA